jgi:hypothetical protein
LLSIPGTIPKTKAGRSKGTYDGITEDESQGSSC